MIFWNIGTGWICTNTSAVNRLSDPCIWHSWSVNSISFRSFFVNTYVRIVRTMWSSPVHLFHSLTVFSGKPSEVQGLVSVFLSSSRSLTSSSSWSVSLCAVWEDGRWGDGIAELMEVSRLLSVHRDRLRWFIQHRFSFIIQLQTGTLNVTDTIVHKMSL